MQCYLCIVAVGDRVCQEKKEAKKVKRKEERRKIMIGTEERRNRNDDPGVKVYNFTVVKENVIKVSIFLIGTQYCVSWFV
jgi:hypothetical protein